MEQPVRSAYYSEDTLQKAPHYHDCHQIIFIRRGAISVRIQDRVYEAGSGNIVLFSRYENHSMRVLSEEYERYVLRISPTFHKSKLYSLLSNRPLNFHNILDVSPQEAVFEQLFCRITEEYHSEDKLAGQMQELLLQELLILLYRRIPTAYIEEENFETVYHLQRRFEERCSEQYSLDALAREYSTSVSALSHQFKKITGSSVMGYLLSCRIASAKNYLTQTRLPVSVITERCGFSDSSNFSRTFKKLTGMTPSEFRKKFRQ